MQSSLCSDFRTDNGDNGTLHMALPENRLLITVALDMILNAEGQVGGSLLKEVFNGGGGNIKTIVPRY